MARIQILELPTEHKGDDMVTPFALVIDQVQSPFLGQWNEAAAKVGARAVLVFEETVDIA